MYNVAGERKNLKTPSGVNVKQASLDWKKANLTNNEAGKEVASATLSTAGTSNPFRLNSTPGNNLNAPVPSADRDIASEIVSLLKSNGPVDYNKLNALAAQREAKIASNPQAFSQFDSTQDLIKRHLMPFGQPQAIQPTPTPTAQTSPIPPVATPPAQPATVDSVMALLSQLAQSSPNYMSYADAQLQAGNELNPQYLDASKQLASNLDLDMEKRGIYNSPLAAGIMAEKQGQLSNEQIAAIAQRAGQILDSDKTLTLQERQLQSSTLSSLLNSLMGREVDLANITGMYNGEATFDRERYNTETELQEGQLMGEYKGQKTLESQQFDFQKEQSNIDNALKEVQLMGRVTTQTQANILGVPIGTSSWEAENAAAERKQELDMFNREMIYKNNSLNLQKQAQAKSDQLDNFNKDMAIWKTTGKAPNTPAMKAYGIQPGTPYSDGVAMSAVDKANETKAQIELIGAEEELKFQNRVTTLMNGMSINNRNTAEAALVVIDQSKDFASAKTIVSKNSKALKEEGIDSRAVITLLDKYYKTPAQTSTWKSIISPSSQSWEKYSLPQKSTTPNKPTLTREQQY